MGSDRVILEKLSDMKSCHQNQITRVVCSGGGAKGVVYPGAYKAMEDTGLLPDIEVFAGSSAGAITAALMAVGMSSALLREALLSTNLKDLMGDSIGCVFRKNKPGICFITKDGKPIEVFLRHHIVNAVIASLKTINHLEDIIDQNARLKKLIIKLMGKEAIFTFDDLALLNNLFPEQFKKVIITAVKFPSGEIQIFDTKQTPDVELALACRASASLPVILEPVTITLNGETQRFIDGGLYDNLPTDYFDRDAHGHFVKNIKPEETLVFAFGEGMDNYHNKVFKALYGERWSEVINERILNKALSMAFKLYKNLSDHHKGFYTSKEKTFVFTYVVKVALDQLVRWYKISYDGSITLLAAIKKSLYCLVNDSQNFLQTIDQETMNTQHIRAMIKIIHDQLKPKLCRSDKFDIWKRTVLLEVLGDVHAPYKNTVREELCYQKIHREYALRTVELRVGPIKTLDFNEASKYSRIMDAFGYLDAINHISNHDLYNAQTFNPELFYINLMFHFDCIYHAVLSSAGKNLKSDRLSLKMNELRKQLEVLGKSSGSISLQMYQFIKMKAEANLNSIEAFALSRAVEYLQQTLTPSDLFVETYKQGFKHSKLFSQSKITGQSFFRLGSLEQSFQGKNMYDLYAKKNSSKNNTRTDKVFNVLKQIRSFREAYVAWLQDADSLDNFYQL